MQLSTNRRATNAWVIVSAVASVILATAADVQGTERAAPHAEAQAAERHRSLITHMRLPGGVGGSHIGISIHDVEESETEGLAEGAVVGEVREESPARRAGLEPGDVVVEFDDERVRSAQQLSRLVQETPAGRSVSATIVRDGDRLEIEIVPERGPAWLAAIEQPLRRAGRDLRLALPSGSDFGLRFDLDVFSRRGRLGVEVTELSPQLAEHFGVEEGVLVTTVRGDSVAAEAGLQAGDVITAIGDQPVEDVGDLRRHTAEIDPGDAFTIHVMRNESQLSLDGRFEEDPDRRRRRGRGI